jgi:sugar phosphate isomerase/epimerase
MSTIAVSSFSLVSILGPLYVEYRDPNGALVETRIDAPQKHTVEEFVALAKTRLGVKAVELCQIQLGPLDDARIDGIRQALDDNDVQLLTVPIDVGDLSGGTPDQRVEDTERIRGWIRVAARLGATFVRVNTGSPTAGTTREDRAGLVEALTTLSDEARAQGVELLIENHGGLSSDPEYLIDIREQVGPDRLGILLDLGNFEPLIGVSHARLAGAAPDDTGLDVSRVYEHIAMLAPVATLVHAKAHDPASDGSPLYDLERALGIVADSGYDGPLTIEWEGLLGDPWEHSARIVDIVRERFPDAVPATAS